MAANRKQEIREATECNERLKAIKLVLAELNSLDPNFIKDKTIGDLAWAVKEIDRLRAFIRDRVVCEDVRGCGYHGKRIYMEAEVILTGEFTRKKQ